MELILSKLFTAPLAALVMGGFALTASAGTEAKAQTTNDDLKATDEMPAVAWFVDNRGGRGKPDARRGGHGGGHGKSGSCRSGRGGGHGKPGAQRGGPQRGPGGPSHG
ncbi:MAG: hypothetical protein QGG55_11615, partial [Verrucomicrobiota bacterium]|nr:hypothetical protein [Verrucomicrobiota bacterium]